LWELVGRWSSLVVIASPLPQTPAIFEVVAPQSVPIKIFRGGFMLAGKVGGNHPEGKNFY
jgi:hypothetical protein